MKAILVIDVPYIDKKQINYLSVSFGGIPHCIGRDAMMLRPLPQKKWHEEGKENECEEWYRNGWNDCLDAITGETE